MQIKICGQSKVDDFQQPNNDLNLISNKICLDYGEPVMDGLRFRVIQGHPV